MNNLVGWDIKRTVEKPFAYIDIQSPDGYAARVSVHDRNPASVLYRLADAILKERENAAVDPSV